MIRSLLRSLLVLLLTGISLNSATLYCGPSSAGSGTGADFTNRMALPNTTGFTRGNVYVVIEGSYGSKTLQTATSGTTTITIRLANAAQDSGVAGYSSTLHDGQATFGTITVKTRYWIVDGIRRTESNSWTAPTGYGFRADQIRASSIDGDDADFSQFRYIDLGSTYNESPSAGTIDNYGESVYLVFNQSDITFTRCALHNGTPTLVQGAGAQNLTFEHCDFGPGWGKEAIRGGNGSITSGWTIRYNRFYDSTQTNPNDGSSGITAEIGMWGWDSGTATGIEIYGNWFSNSKSGGRNAVIVVGGDGGSWSGGGADGTVVYNNTFAGIDEGAVFSVVDLNGSSTVARNNLFYDCVDTDISASTVSDNDVTGADPFQNYSTLDLRLSGATNPGFSLSSPYNSDPLGNTRGGDGTWDRGAFEFQAGGGGAAIQTLNVTNLTITGP